MLRPLSWVLGAHSPLGAFPASVSTSNKCGEAARAETVCAQRGENRHLSCIGQLVNKHSQESAKGRASSTFITAVLRRFFA